MEEDVWDEEDEDDQAVLRAVELEVFGHAETSVSGMLNREVGETNPAMLTAPRLVRSMRLQA